MNVKNLWPLRPSEHDQFEALIQPHLNQLYKLAFRFTGHRDDAEDLVQDILLKLFPRLDEIQAIEKLGPWLARVLYRHFIDRLRSKQRTPLQLLGEDEDKVIEGYSDARPGPAGVKDATILQDQIQHSLNQLNEDQRILVILHEVEGYTLQEIHTMYDVPIGTLKSRLNRARSRLRELLEKMELFDASRRVNQ